ncbi:MAG: hypothetical protein AAGE96_14455 [Cyanobacteria bacterium P01_G01_bin.19]
MTFQHVKTLQIQAENDIGDYLVNPVHPSKKYGVDYPEYVKQAGRDYHNRFLAAVREDFPGYEADVQYTELDGSKVRYGYYSEPIRYIDAHISIRKLPVYTTTNNPELIFNGNKRERGYAGKAPKSKSFILAIWTLLRNIYN